MRCLLNHGKERAFHLLAVDDEGAAENLVAAVLRVDLGKAEDFRVGQPASVLLLQSVQVFYLLGRKGESLLFVVFLKVLHILDGFGLDVNREDVLVKTVVHALQHRVVLGILRCYREVFLDTRNTAEVHVLRDFYGIRRPGGHHFAARTYEDAFQAVAVEQLGIAIEPAKFLYFVLGELVIGLGGNHALLWSLKEKNHSFFIPYYILLRF